MRGLSVGTWKYKWIYWAGQDPVIIQGVRDGSDERGVREVYPWLKESRKQKGGGWVRSDDGGRP